MAAVIGAVQNAAAKITAPIQHMMHDRPEDIFQGADQVMVKQEWAASELVTGCEARNRYRISKPVNGQEGQAFLYMAEESECSERRCCGRNRSLTMKVYQGPSKEGAPVQSMKKPFHCQGCCFCRPSLDVLGAGDTPTLVLGKVTDPCRCCLADQQVYDDSGALMFTPKGSLCQLGFCCALCYPVKFDIEKQGSVVATVVKPPLSCGEYCTRTNRFLINFNDIKDPTERKMLLASTMLLDLEYFE
mmetsp:Transcript_29887/g.79541  ORF Transcript_29887/g.79541 Transcript_29887/m.79541 type:complete len:245 (-) Transcript_29887:195-929(-)